MESVDSVEQIWNIASLGKKVLICLKVAIDETMVKASVIILALFVWPDDLLFSLKLVANRGKGTKDSNDLFYYLSNTSVNR